MNMGTSTYPYGNLSVQVPADEWPQLSGVIKEMIYHQDGLCPLCRRELADTVTELADHIVHFDCFDGITDFLASTRNFLIVAKEAGVRL